MIFTSVAERWAMELTKPRRVLKLEHKKSKWEGSLNATLQKSFRRKSQTFSSYGKNSISTDNHISRSMTVSGPSSQLQKNRYVISRVRYFKITNTGYKNCGDAYEISEMDKRISLRTSLPISPHHHHHHESSISSRHVPCKISVMGSPKVGKTSLIQRLINTEDIPAAGKNRDEAPPNTCVKVRLDDKQLNLDFHETDMRMQRYIPRDSDAFLLVYSLEDRRSLFTVAQLIRQMRHKYRVDSPIFLIANKLDHGNTYVPREDGKLLARLHNCKYMETSLAQEDFDELLVSITKQFLFKDDADLDIVQSDENCHGQTEVRKSKKCRKPFFKLFSGFFKRANSRKEPNRNNCKI